MNLISEVGTTGVCAMLASLDIDGFFTGTEFLTLLANAVSGLLIALFNLLTFGTAAV